MLSRQVSWLAGHYLHPAFPKPEGFSGAIGMKARRLQLRGQLRHCHYLAHRIPS